jgi:hypothetical protein
MIKKYQGAQRISIKHLWIERVNSFKTRTSPLKGLLLSWVIHYLHRNNIAEAHRTLNKRLNWHLTKKIWRNCSVGRFPK